MTGAAERRMLGLYGSRLRPVTLAGRFRARVELGRMDPNPYESPHEIPQPPVIEKKTWHPVTRIVVAVLLVIGFFVTIGILHGIYIEIVIMRSGMRELP
jgi:hypothetical protein